MDTLDYTLSVEEKSMEHYEFVRNHFDFPVDIDYQKFIDSTDRYVVSVRMKNDNPINDIGFLVGVSIFRMSDDKINIDYVAIDKEYRRKGINRAINNLIEDIAVSNFIDYLTANIRETNLNSINSFTRCGFEVDENKVCKYSNGDVKVHVRKNLIIFEEDKKWQIKRALEKTLTLARELPEPTDEEGKRMLDKIMSEINDLSKYLMNIIKNNKQENGCQ